jgi:serine/threonine-protein phosphatase 2A activator
MATTLPDLPRVEVNSLGDAVPIPRIRTEEDVARWHRSRGFETYMLFLHRLNESVVGCMMGDEQLSDASPVREREKYGCQICGSSETVRCVG